MRLVMRSLRAHPCLHMLAMLGASGVVATTVGSAWVLGWITDTAISAIGTADSGQPDASDLALAAAVLIGVSMANGISVMVRRIFLMMAALRTQRDWRRQLLHRYIDLPLSFYRQRPTGELLAHADFDLETATSVLMPLAFALSVVLLVIVALTVLLVIHPLLALIAAVLFPTLAVASRVYTRMVVVPSAEVQRLVGEVSTVAHESFDGALVVKTLGREHIEVERLRDASERLRAKRIHVGRLRGTFEPIIQGLPIVGTIALMLLGSWLVNQGSASPGDLVLAATLFWLLKMPLEIVGYFLEEMPRSVVSLERIDSVLNLPVERSVPKETLQSGPLSLKIDELVVTLGGCRVLNDVSLTVAPGETVALVGSTGSGKSTLLEAVAGLVDTYGGSIELGGIQLNEIDLDDLHDAVALVFQEAFLFADSVAENVALQHSRAVAAQTTKTKKIETPRTEDEPTDKTGQVAGSDAMRTALSTAMATEFIDALDDGVATIVGERGVTLSGGQRQRVALARALIRSPRLLMLDDATSAVDPLVESRILANLKQSLTTTTIVVAHRISTIKLADRVVYMDNGRIVASGTHTKLLDRDDYRSLVTAYERGQIPKATKP